MPSIIAVRSAGAMLLARPPHRRPTARAAAPRGSTRAKRRLDHRRARAHRRAPPPAARGSPSAASSRLPSCSAASARKKRGPGACRVERVRRLEGGARLGGHDAALRRRGSLRRARSAAPPSTRAGGWRCGKPRRRPRCGRAAGRPARSPPSPGRPPAHSGEMRLDLGDQRLDVVRRAGSGEPRGERLAGQARATEAEIEPEREERECRRARRARWRGAPPCCRVAGSRRRRPCCVASSRRAISARAASASLAPMRPLCPVPLQLAELVEIDPLRLLADASACCGARPSGSSTAMMAAAVRQRDDDPEQHAGPTSVANRPI